MTQSPKEDAYWRRTVRLTVVLLLLWFLVTFAVSFFARELNEITVFGFPLGFYMGGQCSCDLCRDRRLLRLANECHRRRVCRASLKRR